MGSPLLILMGLLALAVAAYVVPYQKKASLRVVLLLPIGVELVAAWILWTLDVSGGPHGFFPVAFVALFIAIVATFVSTGWAIIDAVRKM